MTEASDDQQQSDRAGDKAGPRLLRRFASSRLRWLLGLILLGLPLLHMAGLIKLPFAPFTTQGVIYVDSPEVYTRERLVNDRYDQDYWLRRHLEQLDRAAASDLVTRDIDESISAAAGTSNPPTDHQASPVDEQGSKLTFAQRFGVLTGIRDMIRQQILENMLDDRHDLTGNSVYGLKFDTTVIPGANTRQRAFVNITVLPDTLFAGPRMVDTAVGPLPEYLDTFVRKSCSLHNGDVGDRRRCCAEDCGPNWAEQEGRYEDQKRYYYAWLTDIMKRLNEMENSLFKSMPDCPTGDGSVSASTSGDSRDLTGPEFFDELTRRTLRVVLGIPEERFTSFNPPAKDDASVAKAGSVVLPAPWARFMKVSRKPLPISRDGKCPHRVWFDVLELTEQFDAARRDDEDRTCASLLPDCKKECEPYCTMTYTMTEKTSLKTCQEACSKSCGADDCLNPFGNTADRRWTLMTTATGLRGRSELFGTQIDPKFTPPGAALDLLATLMAEPTSEPASEPASERQQDAASSQATSDDAIGRAPEPSEPLHLTVPSGFLNFVKHMSSLDAYSYAIFPKNDVIGVLRAQRTNIAGAGGEGIIGFAQRLLESDTQSVLIGYGDGRSEDPDALGKEQVRFGWIISAAEEMRPTAKSQLALVSVPAWTNLLRLQVQTGWIGSNGAPIPALIESFPMAVSVPPDLETFDSVFREDAGVTRGPRILDDQMDHDIYVVAGRSTSVLIPGSRLWRSATVTLGAQTANRIRVLPNMEGIIAEFSKVDLPYAVYHPRAIGDDGFSIEKDEAEPSCALEDSALAELAARPVRLRVWTSEGVATASNWVCIVYDPRSQITDLMGAAGSANSGALGTVSGAGAGAAD